MLYLMSILVTVLIMKVTIEGESARFMLLGIFALGVGFSAAFLGGHATIRGRVHVPFIGVPRHPMRLSMSGGVFVFIITFIIGARIWPSQARDSRSQSEHAVEEVAGKIHDVWGEYESITDSNSIAPRSGAAGIAIHVKEKSVRLASDMLSVDESTLGYLYLVTKWVYVSYAYCITAALELDQRKRLWLAQRSSWASEYAVTLLDEARVRTLKGKSGYRAAFDVIEKDSIEGEVRYLLAFGLAIRHEASDPAVSAEDVRHAISQIPQSFQHDIAPLVLNPWLKKFLEMGKGDSLAGQN